MYTGIVVFERTDFPEGQAGNRFDTDPMVILAGQDDSYAAASYAARRKASEALRNGAMNVPGSTDSMLAAADRIMRVNNATYSFQLPDGSTGEFLVRVSIVQG